MTLTDDAGRPVQLHPVIAAMIAVLVEKQDGIWKRQSGIAELHFAAQGVVLKVFDGPVFTAHKPTIDKPCPSKY